ncbi:hypothetical protein BC830DRAFT_1099424 [Chytriomyces sp. MP71]|nr:hypothetical protein BC830DRAFT_1099424 [Chytriomyces sp. MP71]
MLFLALLPIGVAALPQYPNADATSSEIVSKTFTASVQTVSAPPSASLTAAMDTQDEDCNDAIDGLSMNPPTSTINRAETATAMAFQATGTVPATVAPAGLAVEMGQPSTTLNTASIKVSAAFSFQVSAALALTFVILA